MAPTRARRNAVPTERRRTTARAGRSFSPTTVGMCDATARVEFRDEKPSASRDGALDRRDDGDSKDDEAGGKDVTREMVVSCIARVGSRRALNEYVDAYLRRLTHVPSDGMDIANKLEVIASVCSGVRLLYLYDNKVAGSGIAARWKAWGGRHTCRLRGRAQPRGRRAGWTSRPGSKCRASDARKRKYGASRVAFESVT